MLKLDQIYNMDCLKGMEQIPDGSIDYVFTSPPYNRERNDKYKLYTDIKKDYFNWLCKVIDEAIRVTKKYTFFNIQKTYYNKIDVFRLIGKYASNIQEIIIWEKTNPMPAAGKAITNSYEFFIVLGKSSLKSNHTYTKNIISTSVNGDMPKMHKAVMKQDVSDWFIENFTKEGDIILDCFMGLGTTAISCLKFNRRYLGFELIEDYVKEANKKIEGVKENELKLPSAVEVKRVHKSINDCLKVDWRTMESIVRQGY